MATATKQLEAINQEIAETFAGHSRITVSALDGDPPEKYEINYRITGLFKDDSGEIQEKDSHTITISIPFGFPHFPPSCKPKSAIFHPDFDPAAICIGDFWEKDRSIPELILHIGQMISGEIYSTSNAFNEEAAKWYKENGDRLPFETLTGESAEAPPGDDLFYPAQEEDTDDITRLLDEDDEDGEILEDISFDPAVGDDKAGEEGAADLSIPSPETGIDTLDDSFLDTDFDYLSTEKDAGDTDELRPPEAVEEGRDEIDIDRFRLMVRQKRFYELDRDLTALSDAYDFDERDGLAGQAAGALRQAREAYDEGTDFEHQGNPAKALAAFKKVESFVSDYPGLKEDISRTAQAKELLGDWAETPRREEERFTAAAVGEDDESPPPAATEEVDVKERKSGTRTFFEETARQTSRLIPFAIGIVALLTIAAIGGYYYLSSAQLDKARAKFSECQAVLKQNRFAEAERQCEAAMDQAIQVQVFNSGDRDSLIAEITGVLNSQVLTEGLAGNLLLDGKYLPKGVVRTVLAFKHFMAAGDEHFNKESWQQAAASYRQALDLAEQKEGVDQELVFAVTENMKIAEFKVLFRSGTEFIRREKWVLATQDLNKALDYVKSLNIENKAELIDDISGKLAEISLATSREEGDNAFAAADWKLAHRHYQDALDAAKKTYPAGNQLIEELNQLAVKARLYDTVNQGKEAFTNAQWDQAISNYEQAIRILEENRELLKQTNTEENRKRLARVMLQASVIRDKQDAARLLRDSRFETAKEKLQSIIDTISQSEFNGEEEFTAVIKDARQAIKQADTDMLLADKISYLEDNFIELFTRHYTASSPEALTEPSVIFEKRLGDKLIFRLQCIEIGRGRPLRLVMKYSHDLNTGTWSFYSGTD